MALIHDPEGTLRAAAIILSAANHDMPHWQEVNGRSDPPGAEPVTSRTGPRVGRNDPCVCGSGVKFKKCCRGKQ